MDELQGLSANTACTHNMMMLPLKSRSHEAATPPRRQTQGQQQFSPGSPSKPRTGATAETLRDGKTLCPDFNNNKCDRKGPSCDKGLHKCAKILRGGRPCGMSYHGAYNCRNV